MLSSSKLKGYALSWRASLHPKSKDIHFKFKADSLHNKWNVAQDIGLISDVCQKSTCNNHNYYLQDI